MSNISPKNPFQTDAPVRPKSATVAARYAMDSDCSHGAVVPPLYLSSTFSFRGYGERRTYDYTRSGNPNRDQLAEALAALEGGKSADLTGTTLGGTRCLVLEDLTEDARDMPRSAFDNAVARMEEAGAQITRASLPSVAEALSLSAVLFSPEAYGTWRETIEAAPEKMFDRILERFRSGQDFSGPDVWAAWNTLHRLRTEYAKATAGYDAVLLPTAPILPPDAARLMSDTDYYVTENLLALRNTRVGNLMGQCGLSLPTGVPACGLMVLAAPMQEERLLRLGHAIETILA